MQTRITNKYKAFDGYSESILLVHEQDGIEYMLGEEIPSYLWEPFNISFFGVRPVLPVQGATVYAHDFLNFVHHWRHRTGKINKDTLLKAVFACWERTKKDEGLSLCAMRGGIMCEQCKNVMPWI